VLPWSCRATFFFSGVPWQGGKRGVAWVHGERIHLTVRYPTVSRGIFYRLLAFDSQPLLGIASPAASRKPANSKSRGTNNHGQAGSRDDQTAGERESAILPLALPGPGAFSTRRLLRRAFPPIALSLRARACLAAEFTAIVGRLCAGRDSQLRLTFYDAARFHVDSLSNQRLSTRHRAITVVQ
jgi:hypothetical protein